MRRKATEIHTPAGRLGRAARRAQRAEAHGHAADAAAAGLPAGAIDNIIDLIRPYVGAYGARVIHLLYEIANDAPYWRNPLITVDTNELLDRLGAKRDPRGIHRSKNRELLRNVLNAAHGLEIVGEYTTCEARARRYARRCAKRCSP